MKVRDLTNVIDSTLPIWVNCEDFTEKYDNYDEMRKNSIVLGDDEVLYITVGDDGILTIEV